MGEEINTFEIQSITENNLRRPNNERPEQWDEHELTRYLENMWSNSLGVYCNHMELVDLIIKVDNLLTSFLFSTDSAHKEGGIYKVLIIRSHSSFRASVNLVFSGMVSDCMPLIRATVEWAGYANLIQNNPSYEKIWLNRDLGSAEKQLARKTFTAGTTIKNLPDNIKGPYKKLYDATITSGAHPNIDAVLANSAHLNNESYSTPTVQMYLNMDPENLDFSLLYVLQSGLIVLKIIETLFPDDKRNIAEETTGISQLIEEYLELHSIPPDDFDLFKN